MIEVMLGLRQQNNHLKILISFFYILKRFIINTKQVTY
jgi:hypothetical protein